LGVPVSKQDDLGGEYLISIGIENNMVVGLDPKALLLSRHRDSQRLGTMPLPKVCVTAFLDWIDQTSSRLKKDGRVYRIFSITASTVGRDGDSDGAGGMIRDPDHDH